MPKKTYTTLPSRFYQCLHVNCPMASTCLRQLAYSKMTENKDIICMVNPRHCSKGKDCKFYRDAAPARYATRFYVYAHCAFWTLGIFRASQRRYAPFSRRTENSSRCPASGRCKGRFQVRQVCGTVQLVWLISLSLASRRILGYKAPHSWASLSVCGLESFYIRTAVRALKDCSPEYAFFLPGLECFCSLTILVDYFCLYL